MQAVFRFAVYVGAFVLTAGLTLGIPTVTVLTLISR